MRMRPVLALCLHLFLGTIPSALGLRCGQRGGTGKYTPVSCRRKSISGTFDNDPRILA